MRVTIEKGDSVSITSDPNQTDDGGLKQWKSFEEDRQSELSFIVKEKLHIFAGNIRRRTSEVKLDEEIDILEPSPFSVNNNNHLKVGMQTNYQNRHQ